MATSVATSTLSEERRLHERLLAGEALALAEIYDHYSATVLGVALRVTTDQAAADDVTQSVFIDLWRHPERYRPELGSLRPWLVTVARHRSLDWLRQDQATRRRDDQARPVPQPPPDTAEVVEGMMTAQRVRGELAKLPESERIPIHLAYFTGQTYRQVAAAVDLPEGTVKSRIRSGLRHLAAALQADDSFVPPPDDLGPRYPHRQHRHQPRVEADVNRRRPVLFD